MDLFHTEYKDPNLIIIKLQDGGRKGLYGSWIR